MEYESRRKSFSFLMLLGLVILFVGGGWLATHSDTLNKTLKTAEISQPGMYSVDHFVDGDTIAVNMNGNIETIRMIGIDTPETHKPNTPVQCYGPQAANYTEALIGSQKVRLQADPLNTNRDRYGRLLRYVYVADGRMVEEELIKNGYAFAYTQFPFEKKAAFEQLEHAAEDNKAGLWGACAVTVEDNGREQTNNQ